MGKSDLLTLTISALGGGLIGCHLKQLEIWAKFTIRFSKYLKNISSNIPHPALSLILQLEEYNVPMFTEERTESQRGYLLQINKSVRPRTRNVIVLPNLLLFNYC